MNRNCDQAIQAGKVAWRVDEWHKAVGVSRAHCYNLISAKTITSIKAGKLRLITTSPSAYIASFINDDEAA